MSAARPAHRPDHRIDALARQQHGVVTRAQLLEAGLSSSAVSRRVAVGRLRRLHAAVYLVGPVEPLHAREMAAVLAVGPDAVLSHASAADVWGLDARDRREPSTSHRPRRPVEITVPGGRGGRRRGVHVYRVAELPTDERTEHLGLPTTTPARTLLDLAGRLVGPALERRVARAERLGLVSPARWAVLLERHRGRRGVAVLRAVVGAPGGASLTRSEAEARFLSLVRTAGLPPPRTNARVGPYELDCLWPRQGLAVEVDGFRYHSSRARFESDRLRDARLLARGIRVVRLTWRQIADEPVRTVALIARALGQAGGR